MAPISTSASMAWSALDYEAVLPLRMRPAASGGGGGGGHHHPVSLPLTLNSSKSYSSLCSTLSSEVGGEGGHGQGGAPYGGPPAPPAPAKPPRAVQYAPSRRAFSAAVAALHDAHTRSKSYSDLSHVGSCNMEPVYCDNKCGSRVHRKHLAQHKSGECPKRLVSCRHCAKNFSHDTLQAHHGKCGRHPIVCPNQCESPKLAREELESHLKDHCPALIVSCPFKEAGCRFKGPRYSLEEHQEEAMRQHLLLMCGVATRQQQQLASLRTAVARGVAAVNHTGTFLWRVGDLQAKMADAKLKEGYELVSAPFYTSQYGYKLQATLFLNGNGSGEGTHMSVYIKLLPGDYDALLQWPFAHTVSFTLYDQAANPDKACNIVESFIPDAGWENFQRPSRQPDALGFGFPRFVSHEMLKKRHFVKDDVLFLKVRVDPAKNMAV